MQSSALPQTGSPAKVELSLKTPRFRSTSGLSLFGWLPIARTASVPTRLAAHSASLKSLHVHASPHPACNAEPLHLKSAAAIAKVEVDETFNRRRCAKHALRETPSPELLRLAPRQDCGIRHSGTRGESPRNGRAQPQETRAAN